MTTAEIDITIPEDAWVPAGDEDEPGGERAVLVVVPIVVGGTHHHAVAYQAVPGSHDPQRVLQRDEDVDLYAAACGADGPFETTTIAGTEYLIFVTPFD